MHRHQASHHLHSRVLLHLVCSTNIPLNRISQLTHYLAPVALLLPSRLLRPPALPLLAQSRPALQRPRPSHPPQLPRPPRQPPLRPAPPARPRQSTTTEPHQPPPPALRLPQVLRREPLPTPLPLLPPSPVLPTRLSPRPVPVLLVSSVWPRTSCKVVDLPSRRRTFVPFAIVTMAYRARGLG